MDDDVDPGCGEALPHGEASEAAGVAGDQASSPAGRWSTDYPWGYQPKETKEVLVSLVASEVALRFAAREGMDSAELAAHPLVLDESGVVRWPYMEFRYVRPMSPAGGFSPLFTERDFKRFYRENRRGFMLRDFHHPAGRFAIGVHGSALRLEVGLGGDAAVFRAVGRHCAVHLPCRLPESIRLSIRGMKLNDVVAHEAFAEGDLRIVSAVEKESGATRLTVFDKTVKLKALARVSL